MQLLPLLLVLAWWCWVPPALAARPTRFPSSRPSRAPSSASPSAAPSTPLPSASPTTSQPSVGPSTSQPSVGPSTSQPSKSPSRAPSGAPSRMPSANPSTKPSRGPSRSPSRGPSRSPSRAPTRRCVVRVGMVYSMTGPLRSDQPRAGLTTAIGKINSGDWAEGRHAPGFAFNQNLVRCMFEATYMDDKSDPVLHVELTRVLASVTDVLVEGGTITSQAVRGATVVAEEERTMIMLCCSPSATEYSASNPFVFGVAGPSAEYTHLLMLQLALVVPQPRIGIVFDSTDPFQVETCTNAKRWAGQVQMDVSYIQEVNMSQVANFTAWLEQESIAYRASGAQVLVTCVGLEQSKDVASVVFQSAQHALYVTQGPGVESFDALKTSDGLSVSDYVFSTSPWVSTMPWHDPVMGNASSFTQAFHAYNPLVPVGPNANAVAVASILYLVMRALMRAGAGTTYDEIQDFFDTDYNAFIQAMRETDTETVYGPVRFDNTGRNLFSESVATVQLQSPSREADPIPLAVLPLEYAQSVMIYPAPTKPYCIAGLDAPSVFDEFNTSGRVGVAYPTRTMVQCKAWERTVRMDGEGAVKHTNMSNAACGVCQPLYQTSQCDDSSSLYTLTLFPSMQVNECGGGGSGSGLQRCSRWFDQSTTFQSNTSFACSYVTFGSGAGIFSVFILCLGCVVCLLFGGFVFYYRESQPIKYAQYHLLMVFVMGSAAVCLCGIVFVGPPTWTLCQLRTWLFNLSVSVTLTPLFLKVWRVWMLFENPKLKHIVITDATLAKMTVCVLLVELLWLALWTGISPTQPMCSQVLSVGLATPIPVVQCGNTEPVFPIVAAVLIGLQILSCLVLSFLARRVSVVFAEREVGLAALNITVVGAVVAFVYFFTNTSESIKVPLVCFALAWCSSFSVALLVGPKAFWIYHMTEEEVKNLAFIKKKTSTPASGENAAAVRRFESGISGNRASGMMGGGGSNDNTMENLTRETFAKVSMLEAENATLKRRLAEMEAASKPSSSSNNNIPEVVVEGEEEDGTSGGDVGGKGERGLVET